MTSPEKPLAGVRVLSQAIVWAGPFATLILSDLGAEVIEVESIQHLNPTRASMRHMPQPLLDGIMGTYYLNRDGSEGFWNRQAWFNYGKRGVKSVTLDLNRPRGRELFLELAKASDAFIENNAAGVVERLGIDYPALKAVNPRLIMVRFPGFGLDGPYRDFKGYGANMEAVAGHTMVRGYEDSDPSLTPPSYHGDPNAAAHVAFMLQAALYARERTGEGQLIEISQAEAVTHHLAYFWMDYAMNQRVHGHMGNSHPSMAPYGAFPCAGEDRWIAIAVPSDEVFATLCGLMEQPALAVDERFATVATRHEHRREIDAIVGEWTRSYAPRELMLRLQAEGVPAMELAHQQEITEDPHLQARGFFQEITQVEAGTHLFPGPMAKFERVPIPPLLPAPTLGQHNEEVLRGILGLGADEYQQLIDDELIGTVYLESATSG